MKLITLPVLTIATVLGLTTIQTKSLQAATINYDLTVNNMDGSLTGENFTGNFNFDDATLSGSGSEFIPVSDLTFNFLGNTYTEDDDNSTLGVEAEFLDGEFLGLSYSTDVEFSFVPGFFSLSESFFAYDFGAGDNGTGDVVYTEKTDNPNPATVPEPTTILSLLTTILFSSGMLISKKKCS